MLPARGRRLTCLIGHQLLTGRLATSSFPSLSFQRSRPLHLTRPPRLPCGFSLFVLLSTSQCCCELQKSPKCRKNGKHFFAVNNNYIPSKKKQKNKKWNNRVEAASLHADLRPRPHVSLSMCVSGCELTPLVPRQVPFHPFLFFLFSSSLDFPIHLLLVRPPL